MGFGPGKDRTGVGYRLTAGRGLEEARDKEEELAEAGEHGASDTRGEGRG